MSGVGLVDWAFIVVNVEGIIRNEIKLYKWVESVDPLQNFHPYICVIFSKAKAAVDYLDQIHQMKKRGLVPNSLYMEQLILRVGVADFLFYGYISKIGKTLYC